jgi:16S rRNA processing protein RimM
MPGARETDAAAARPRISSGAGVAAARVGPHPTAPPQAGEGLRGGEGLARRVCIGVVTGPHGVRGAVRIKSFTARPEDVVAYGSLGDETGTRQFDLQLIGSAKGVVIVRLAGVHDRNHAEALRGQRLYLPRAALPPPQDEEFYHADLIGLAAVLADGTELGRVRAIHDFGAGDMLEIERHDAPPAMVPFTRAVVPMVEIAARRLVIDPPAGLLDEIAGERSAARADP